MSKHRYSIIILFCLGLITVKAQNTEIQIEGKLLTPENAPFTYSGITYNVEVIGQNDTLIIEELIPCSMDNENYVLCIEVNDGLLAQSPEVRVIPVLSKDPINGVSTLDIVQTMRHILGITPFEEAYQLLAADINSDLRISAFDLVQSRNLILFINDQIDGPVWKFVEEDAYATMIPDIGFAQSFQPAQFTYQPGLNSYAGINFIVIKTGDVNLTYTTN